MSLFDLLLQTSLSYLQKLAERSLSLWDVPEDARVRLIKCLGKYNLSGRGVAGL